MAINWNMTLSDGEQSIVVFLPDENKTVSDKHPNFRELLKFLANLDGDEDNDDESFETILELTNIATSVSQKLTRLSERISTDGSNVYFDGDALDSSVAAFLLKALRAEGLIGGNATEAEADVDDIEEGSSNVSWQAIINFLERLYQNPSAESIQHLYNFIGRYSLTIRPNGDFIAFKGLLDDYSSIHAGPGIVNGVLYKHKHLDNSPGNVVEISRSYVNADAFVGCSTGLHAGSFEYASGFSRGKVVAVAINPRDVVSVPTDHSYQKLRVARYEVLNDVPGDYTRNDENFMWTDDDDCYDDEGYDIDGYDEDGYDRDGYSSEGYDENGYDRDGYSSEGYNDDGYDDDGYDEDGYDREGYNSEGYNDDGYDEDGYNREGYDRDGYNRDGYDKDGYNREGYDRDGYNRDGYDKDGYNREGYDRDGYNRDGYDKDGYDIEGYDEDDYNSEGRDRDGYPREREQEGSTEHRNRLWETVDPLWKSISEVLESASETPGESLRKAGATQNEVDAIVDIIADSLSKIFNKDTEDDK